jgi:hypothetical protein
MLLNIRKPFCNIEFLLLPAQSISGLDVGFFGTDPVPESTVLLRELKPVLKWGQRRL